MSSLEQLATQKGFDLKKARQDGVPEEQIRSFLTQSAPAKTEPLAVRAFKALTASEQGFGGSIAGAIQPFTASQKSAEQGRANVQETAGKALDLVHEKIRNGEDPSRLLNALKQAGELPDDFELNPALNKTNMQVLGEAAGVATDIASFGTVGKAAKAAIAPRTIAKGIVQGAKQGAKAGAIVGGAKSLSTGLQEGQSVPEAIGQGAAGAVTGAAAGGLIGGLVGGVSGGVAGRIDRKRELSAMLDETRPTGEAVRYTTTQAGGVTKDKTAVAAIKAGLDERDVQFIKNSSGPDASLFKRQYLTAQAASKDKTVVSRPAELGGKETINMLSYVDKKRQQFGALLDRTIKQMPNKALDITPQVSQFTDDLSNQGISVGENGKLIFKDSIFANDAGVQKLIQNAYNDIRPGNAVPQRIALIRRKLFRDLDLGTKSNTISGPEQVLLGKLRDALEEPLQQFPQYAKYSKSYAQTRAAVSAFNKLMGKEFETSSTVAPLRAGEVGMRILGNASARPLGALNEIGNIARQLGYKSDINIRNQFLFADLLEDVFPLQATRSLTGGVQRGVEKANEAIGIGGNIARGQFLQAAGAVVKKGAEMLGQDPATIQREALAKLIGL